MRRWDGDGDGDGDGNDMAMLHRRAITLAEFLNMLELELQP